MIFAITILPVVLLMWFIYKKDKYHPEPLKALLKAFLCGCLCTIPAGILNTLFSNFAPESDILPIGAAAYMGLMAGTDEELCKLLFLAMAIWKSPHFDEYFDGIVYACFFGLGFACLENIEYVYLMGNDPMVTALSRGLTAVPAHFLFAVTMGYYFSLAKFDKPNRKKHLWHAFFYPMLLHATYDAILFAGNFLDEKYGEGNMILYVVSIVLTVAFIIFDVMLWRWGMKRIKRMQERSKEQDFDRRRPFDGFIWNV